MTNLKIKPLKELVSIKGGKRLPKGFSLQKNRNNHPYIKVANMENPYVLQISENFEFLENETYELLKKYTVQENDIILSIVGTIGRVNVIGKTLKSANLTENCVRLYDFKDINPHYLYYFLVSQKGQTLISNKIVGAVQKKLPIKNIKEIEITYPNRETQDKIVSILDNINELIIVKNEINRNLVEQLKLIFRNKFLLEHSGSSNGTLSDYVISFKGGDWGKAQKTDEYNKDVFCVRGADIPDLRFGNLNKTPKRFLTERKLNNKSLKPGHIVIEASGGSPTQSTGRCFLVTSDLLNNLKNELICSNFCKFLTVKPNYENYVYYYLQFLYDSNILFSFENGTTGIKNLNIKRLLTDWEIIIPKEEDLKEFNRIVLLFHKMIIENSKEINTLTTLRDYLLPKLISGEINVLDLNI